MPIDTFMTVDPLAPVDMTPADMLALVDILAPVDMLTSVDKILNSHCAAVAYLRCLLRVGKVVFKIVT
ncbi:unnamed protein product [Toxocara canis]|uniref:Phage tail protein n=1 Tax=Toxocara canis TaxID=6265 RepID=A0A183V2B2_TOXCA|nr:unnamed protein product [Toxocara canis]